jgi:hypothetical protein
VDEDQKDHEKVDFHYHEKLSWMGFYITYEGNYKKEQDQGPFKGLKRVQEVVGPDGNLLAEYRDESS